MVSSGRCVADSPIRWSGGASAGRRRSRRSRDSARCAPRLPPAIAWTSSTITVSTPRSVSRAALVSSRYRLSGVVTRMSGGRRASSRRCSWGVSPVRPAIEICGSGSPSRCAASPMPCSGARRLRSTSYVSAFSGETYSTRTLPGWVFVGGGDGCRASRSRHHRNAARVLPLPVGAWMQRVAAGRDRRPAPDLRRCRRLERGLEPGADGGREGREGIAGGGRCLRRGRRTDRAARLGS